MSNVNRAKSSDSTGGTVPDSTGGNGPRTPPPERSRRPGRAAVRQRLLDSALGVFAERGYANARLDQVAASAGLTKGAIYSNFASKDDVFFAMMEDQVLNRVEAIRAALLAGTTGASERMTQHDVGRLLTEAFTEQRAWQLVFLDFWLRAVRDDKVRLQFLAHRVRLRAVIAETVQEVAGQTAGPGGYDTDEAVTVLLALCNGFAIEKYIDPGAVPDDLFGRILTQLSPS